MDIGVPYRLLGHVDGSEIAKRLTALPKNSWIHTDFNRQAIAGKEHAVADTIYLRKDWHPGMHKSVRTPTRPSGSGVGSSDLSTQEISGVARVGWAMCGTWTRSS